MCKWVTDSFQRHGRNRKVHRAAVPLHHSLYLATMKSSAQHWMTSAPQTFCWKRLYFILCGLHTSMLPLPCICRQVCDMTKMETSLWTWFLGVSSFMAVHKSSPCSFPWYSYVLCHRLCKLCDAKILHCCLVARTVRLLQSWKNLREEAREHQTQDIVMGSPKLCLKGLW